MARKKSTKIFWSCWRLITNNGRQFWSYKNNSVSQAYKKRKGWTENQWLNEMSKAFSYETHKNPNTGDRVFRAQSDKKIRINPTSSKQTKGKVEEALTAGWDYFFSLQDKESGHFPGDYGGPLFLLPGLVLFSTITDFKISKPEITLIIRYILNHQNQTGGWGLHIEGSSIMFTTVLNYVALRLLGVQPTTEEMARARNWIQKEGGAVLIPSWGKYFLSILGIYDWKGNHSLFPEAWLLPKWIPFCPQNFWCHARMVHLPLSYLYSIKFTSHPDKLNSRLFKQIKQEIYLPSQQKIKWEKTRNLCHSKDLFFPLKKSFEILYFFINFYEKFHSKKIRQLANQKIIKLIQIEDHNTHSINIGPISKIYNALVIFHLKESHKKHHKPSLYKTYQKSFKKHTERLKDYLWLAEDGLKMSGYNGSQFWDTVFAGQAFFDDYAEKKNQYKKNILLLKNYLLNQQLDTGGWPFSTKDNSWAVSDCSAEGLFLSIEFLRNQLIELSDNFFNKLKKSVDFILSLQNQDGGWASYEKRKAPQWFEFLNSSMIFGNIIVDYSYVECTSAVIQGLENFSDFFSQYKKLIIKKAICKARKFIISKQKNDGSWYGSWAICFTYGILFSVKGLISKYNSTSPDDFNAAQKSCDFLINQQNFDGSWGESYLSSSTKIYHSIEGQVVNTSWALLTLMLVDKKLYKKEIKKGINFLLKNQEKSGDWPQQRISGVFNQNCMITYINYRNIFPLWALAKYKS